MEKLKRGKHCVYNLNYHLVLVVKYRKKCINDEISDFLISECRKIVLLKGGEFIEANTDKDHIHILFSIPPAVCLSVFVGVLKNSLSRLVRRNYSEYLKDYLWGDAFWSDSYYIASSGEANIETIQKYIEDQGKPKRKYTRHPKDS